MSTVGRRSLFSTLVLAFARFARRRRKRRL
jgi:hypothetical protein